MTKVSNRQLVGSLVAILATGVVASACGSDGKREPAVDDDSTGQATLALTTVPADVSCVRITVAGNRTSVSSFDVVPSQSAVLTLRGLPIGNVTFSEEAFAEACSAVTASSIPTWVSDPVAATLASRVVASVRITLRRNGEAIVTSDFVDDGGTATPGAGGASGTGGATGSGGSGPCTPIPFDVACANRECGTVSNGCGSNYSCGSCTDPCFPVCGGGMCNPISACLVAGTPIARPDGSTTPIEQVKVGDLVLAYDLSTGTARPQRVTQTFHHREGENHEGMVLINGTVRSTGNHPVYSNGRWVRADSLSVGDRLVTLSGGFDGADAPIATVEMLPGNEETFNLEVDGDHDYFAGGILVHNKPLPCP